MSKADKRKETSKQNIRKAQQSKSAEQRELKMKMLSLKKRLTKKEEEWMNKWKPKSDEEVSEEEEEEPKEVKKEKKKVIKKDLIVNAKRSNRKKEYEVEEKNYSSGSDSSDEEEIIIRPRTKKIIKEVYKKDKEHEKTNDTLEQLKTLVESFKSKEKMPQINIINPGNNHHVQTEEVKDIQKKILLNF